MSTWSGLLKDAAVRSYVASSKFHFGEVLVPKQECRLGWVRHLVARRAADQITADGNDRLAAFRPERSHDVCRARAPVKAGDDGSLDFEGIHQSNDVEGDRRLLGVPHRFAGEKPRGAVASQIGDYHPVAGP